MGWVVSFTPRPLYPRGKGTLYSLNWRLGGPRAGMDVLDKKKILPSWASWPLQSSYFDTEIELFDIVKENKTDNVHITYYIRATIVVVEKR